MFTPNNRRSLVAYIAASCLSFAAVLFLLGVLLSRKQTIRPIGLFFLYLLFWELVQAFAGIMTLRWAVLDVVEIGTFCAAQAVLNLLNSTGTALATIGLSWCILHDYVFQARKPLSLKWAFIILVAMSILQVVVILVPDIAVGANKLYQPSGIWCWLPEHHLYALKIVTTYLFYWMAAGLSMLSALAYLASAAVGKRLPSGYFWVGFLTRKGGLLWMGFFSELDTHDREPWLGFTFDLLWFGKNKSILFVQYLAPTQELPANPDDQTRSRMRDAMRLLLFPVSYAILVIPPSVVRFLTFKGHDIGPATTIFSGTWFALTGFIQFLLFISLKPDFGFQVPRILGGSK